MHMILMTRGVNTEFERWKKFMETQMFLWKRKHLLKDEMGNFIKDKDGKNIINSNGEYMKVQGVLRPIQLFEYIFPDKSPILQNGKEVGEIDNVIPVLAMMGNLHQNVNNLRKEVKGPSWILRKSMNLKPIPKMPEALTKLDRTQITDKFVPMEGMAVYPVGIKEDVFGVNENYGSEQEML